MVEHPPYFQIPSLSVLLILFRTYSTTREKSLCRQASNWAHKQCFSCQNNFYVSFKI